MFPQPSFNVVCQVDEGDWIDGGGGAARHKSKNLLCGSGRVGCGKVAGLFVTSLFGPLFKGFQQGHLLNL